MEGSHADRMQQLKEENFRLKEENLRLRKRIAELEKDGGNAKTPDSTERKDGAAVDRQRSTDANPLRDGSSGTDFKGKKRTICRDFVAGNCTYGDKCRFNHDLSITVSDSTVIEKVDKLCRDFKEGNCRLGEFCKFRHIDRPVTKSNIFCKDFINGHCRWGESCRFRHTVCTECGEKGHDRTLHLTCPECGERGHDVPKATCLHCGDHGDRPGRQGGRIVTSLGGEGYWACCRCADTGMGNWSADCNRHRERLCKCFPFCPECRSRDHVQPSPACYHIGWWDRGRMGGWTNAEDGMAADWHCCGCDDSSNRDCENHRTRMSCGCFRR